MPDPVGNIPVTSTISSTTGDIGVANLTVTGIVAFQGGNLTGTDMPLLGASAPALSDPTNPDTWVKIQNADGEYLVFPAWKLA
jgi:hypothetical protein